MTTLPARRTLPPLLAAALAAALLVTPVPTTTVASPVVRPGTEPLASPVALPGTDDVVGAVIRVAFVPPPSQTDVAAEAAAAGPAQRVPVDPATARLLAGLRLGAEHASDRLLAAPQSLAALDFALDQVGRPYVWGAAGPEGYDCSGLTSRAYASAGVAIPRVSRDQHAVGGVPVPVAELLPGDLVFFATEAWDPGVVHHVGMYAGEGLMVAAPRPGLTVRVEPVPAEGYVGAVRVVAPRPAPVGPPRPESRPRSAPPPNPSPVLPDPAPAEDPTPAEPTPTEPTPTEPTPTEPTPTEPTPTGTPTPPVLTLTTVVGTLGPAAPAPAVRP